MPTYEITKAPMAKAATSRATARRRLQGAGNPSERAGQRQNQPSAMDALNQHLYRRARQRPWFSMFYVKWSWMGRRNPSPEADVSGDSHNTVLGRWAVLMRGAADVITISLADEIAAGLGTGFGLLGDYDQELARQRGIDAA